MGEQTEMTTRNCLICNSEFTLLEGQGMKRTCSDECRKKHNNLRRKKNILKHLETFKCIHCEKEVTRYRKRNGFCSRSCASKKYIEDGTYDKWRLRVNEKIGINKECIKCKTQFYCEPRDMENKKLCGSEECRKSYMSEYMTKNNPSFGKKEKLGVREKVKNTLLEKYGVKNAFALAKHISLSKPQKELIEYLKNNTKYTIFYDFPIYNKQDKLYKVDIYIKELNQIIEFNGTYWHADPRFYKEDFVIKKKQKTSKQIWEEDQKRLKDLSDMGYKVKVIWEYDYKLNKNDILTELVNE